MNGIFVIDNTIETDNHYINETDNYSTTGADNCETNYETDDPILDTHNAVMDNQTTMLPEILIDSINDDENSLGVKIILHDVEMTPDSDQQVQSTDSDKDVGNEEIEKRNKREVQFPRKPGEIFIKERKMPRQKKIAETLKKKEERKTKNSSRKKKTQKEVVKNCEEKENSYTVAKGKEKCENCEDELDSEAEQDGEKNIGCDSCPRWFHLQCTNLSNMMYEEAANMDYQCDFCK
ncbi:hypothetical protein FQR65_LT17691 [Abscondita terminalis]|nr:hypothetical protein FQR65_LT17691 [Abscondita terminalis]